MEERAKICAACGIYQASTKICNANLYVHPETNDVSTSPKLGYIKGCGCALEKKIKNPNSRCPAGKW